MAGETTINAGGSGTNPNETLADILAKPLSEEEARKLIADVDVQLAQLHAIQIQKNLELDNINAQIAAAQFDKSIIYRRVLNAPAEETK